MVNFLKGIAYLICAVACLVMTLTLRDLLARNQASQAPQERTQTANKSPGAELSVTQNSNIAVVDIKRPAQQAGPQTVSKPAFGAFFKEPEQSYANGDGQQRRPNATIVDAYGKITQLYFHDPGFDVEGFLENATERTMTE